MTWIVPIQFCVKPFYEQSDVVEVQSTLLENFRLSPFIFDIGYALGTKNMERPWEEWRKQIRDVFITWEKVNKALITHYRKRDKKAAREPMVAMIALLIDAIFWLNERPIHSLVDWKSDIIELENCPINIVERIQFMLDSPDHFHSYNQLKSLFTEVEKSYFRKLAINN